MATMFTPSQVEEQLRALQRELSPAEARSSLFNLVIFSRETVANPVDRALSFLLGKRAARIIQIVNVPGHESSMSVTARCYPDRENKGVCFQEVLIRNGDDDAGAAVGTWTPLLVRDIPAYVLWYDGVAARREVLSNIRDFADKLILDSEWSEQTGESPEATFDVITTDFVHTGTLVSDLTWRRSLALRLITAYIFDSEATLPLLDRVTKVEIGGTSAATAELYFLWLASRLDWSWEGTFTFRDGYWTARDHGGRDILMSRTNSSVAAAEHGNIEVSIHLDGGDVLSLHAEPGGPATVTIPGTEAARYHYRLPTEGEMLLEEVDALRSDFLFAEAMRRLED